MDKRLRKDMTLALFYKEWIKLKWPTVTAATVFLLVIVYIFVDINHTIRTTGAVSLWDMIVHKDYRLINMLKYLPLFSGLAVGITQFAPEIQKRRLKLTLHLPMSENRIILHMLMFGLAILFTIYTISTAVLYGGLSTLFAPEIVDAWILASLPWYAAGFAAYLIIAWIAIEPTWRQRMFNTMLALPLLSTFYISNNSFGYTYLIPFTYLISVVVLVFVYRSVLRFKEGVQ